VRDASDIATVAPAIDLAAALERVMGERALLQRVLARFASDYRDVGARLRAALAMDGNTRDAALAQRIAHTLKGASAMIDAGPLRQRALALELALKGGNKDDAGLTALVDALDAELVRVLRQVEAMLAAPEAAFAAAATAAVAEPIPEQELARLRAMLDIGDGRAPDLVRQWRAGLEAMLGHARMRTFDAAIERFDFERALALLEQQEERADG
jgi:two-component system sensor histidine kinase/response regulator